MSKQSEIVNATNQYLIPNYGRLPLAMVRGENARVWDADGREYLDFFAGFGAGGVAGHCHPKIVSAVQKQVAELMCHGNLFTNAPQVELAERITRHAFGGKVFFCHSGAEADEAALKLCRLAAGPKRYKIISFHNCFHGRTMGALSLTPRKYQEGFDPMLAGNIHLPMDLDAVAKAMDGEVAGVFIEPIQGEGGVNMPGKAFMQGLRKLCDQHGALLVCDEVWTAPARTGEWFGWQLWGVAPDVMTLGKALGGGLPVAACVAAPKYQDVLTPGKHGCTMGGNPVCAAAGAATMKLVEDENLTEVAKAKGRHIVAAVQGAKLGVVKDVRGAGLMLGIELDRPGKDAFDKCLEKGLIINCTQEKVLRLAPPIVVSDDLLDKGVEVLIEVLKSL